MRRQTSHRWIYVPILFFILLPLSSAEAKKKVELVGQETTYFSLPSSQDRLISYCDEYYGKYNLIITFFPAAFTPI